MFPAGNKAKRLSSVNHTTKTIHHHHQKYYTYTILEESKYVQEKIKIENYIDEDIEKSDSNDERESDFDNDE